MLGQAHHFRNYAPERIDYAYDRYTNEAKRLYRVLDRRLGEARFLAGDEYSIADIASWPWMRRPENQGVDRGELPNYRRWFDEIAEQPTVKRGIQVQETLRSEGFDATDREERIGTTQSSPHEPHL